MFLNRSRLLLFSTAMLTVLGPLANSRPVGAQSFTVTSGTTVNTTQTANGNNTTGLIEEGGTISITTNLTDGAAAVGDGVLLTNNGLIVISGDGSDGMLVSGNNSLITNNGSIVTSGSASHGIEAFGITSGHSFVNNGTILTSGGSASGVLSTGILSSFTNTGGITTTADDAAAVVMVSDANAFFNSGTVNTNGANSVAIVLRGLGSSLTNTGTVTANGDAAAFASTGDFLSLRNEGTMIANADATGIRGVVSISGTGTGIQIINTGSIIGAGAETDGVIFEPTGAPGDIGDLTNSGRIIVPLDRFAFQSVAVDSNETLTLMDGNIIQGRLDMGSGTDDVLDVQRGLSLDYTFESGGVPENVVSNGATVTRVGNRVIIIDPSSVQIAPNMGGEIAGAVLDAVGSRNNGTLGTSGALVSTNGPFDGPAGDGRYGIWGTSFADFANLPSNNGINASKSVVAGFVIGGDAAITPDISAGVFGGFAQGYRFVDGGNDSSAPSFFGGIYANYTDLVSASIVGGSSQGNYYREILNNTVAGGIQRIDLDLDGYYLAPEVTLRAPEFTLAGLDMQAGVRGRYIFESTGSETDTASGATSSVSGTTTHTFDVRTQLDVNLVDTDMTQLALNTGFDYRATPGGRDVTLTIAGTTSSVSRSALDDHAFGGFVGASLNHAVDDHIELFAASEVGVMTDVDIAGDIKVGFRLNF